MIAPLRITLACLLLSGLEEGQAGSAARVASGIEPRIAAPDSSLPLTPENSSEELENVFDYLIQQLVYDAIPREYEDRKEWGRTIEIVSGLNVRREGLELRTSRRRKQVPHGHWKIYRVELDDPKRDLQIQLVNPRETDEGVQFDIHAVARLQTFARYTHWRYGVKLLSVSGDADARVQLRATCQVALKLDPTRFPPDVLVVPRIRQAEIRLLEFDLQRLSHLRGDLAHELGRGLRSIMNDMLRKRQDKLTARMNQQLAKKQEKMRLSLHDMATSRWPILGKREQGEVSE